MSVYCQLLVYNRSLHCTAYIVHALCLFALYVWWLQHGTLHKIMNLSRCTVGLPEFVAPVLEIIIIIIAI